MSRIAQIIRTHQGKILAEWIREQTGRGIRKELVRESELRTQSEDVLRQLASGFDGDSSADLQSAGWEPLRDVMTNLSRSRQLLGFSPSETVHFVVSLKRPLIGILRDERGTAEELERVHAILDQLSLHVTEVFQLGREEVIRRQQSEMLELSTPVVKLWDGVLALPLIGTLDSHRTSVVMETLLQRIVDTNSQVAIIDITGVPTVDTLVAQHLLKTVAAARLMGAECIVSGIRPQIAQTIVHLGVDLTGIVTKASLADAFAVALRHLGLTVTVRE
jgi:rsbT co-antagonist protein RsbR